MTEDIQKLTYRIIDACAQATGFTREDVMGDRRHGELIMARHLAWMIIYDMTADLRKPNRVREITLKMLGEMCGEFSHSTVLHGINKARSKVWGDDFNPPLVSWASTYEEVITGLTPAIIEDTDLNTFFPHTPVGIANARKFLYDIGKASHCRTSTERIIIFANHQINKYRS